MQLQFRLLQNERLNCSECTEIMEYGDKVYLIPDKDVVLFICEMCHAIKLDEDHIALLAGNRRIAR